MSIFRVFFDGPSPHATAKYSQMQIDLKPEKPANGGLQTNIAKSMFLLMCSNIVSSKSPLFSLFLKSDFFRPRTLPRTMSNIAKNVDGS